MIKMDKGFVRFVVNVLRHPVPLKDPSLSLATLHRARVDVRDQTERNVLDPFPLISVFWGPGTSHRLHAAGSPTEQFVMAEANPNPDPRLPSASRLLIYSASAPMETHPKVRQSLNEN